jgi:hypothetical protein
MAEQLKLDAELTDGQKLTAVCDQRDYAGWEAAEADGLSGAITRMRWLAWSALRRVALVKEDWLTFNRTLCVEVVAADSGEPEDGQRLDPGPKAARAGR